MKYTILLIEDNEQNAYLTSFILKQHGCEIVHAHDGIQGIEMAASIQPALILLDIQLPQMDGYDVARALRRNPDLRDVPIVAVTSYAMAGDRERILESGCSRYLEKPINPDTFSDEIVKFLKARASGGESRP